MRSLVLGNKIRQFRQRAGLSQMQLELEIDAAPGSLSRIESGQVNPTKETLNKISQILKLEIQETATLFNIDLDAVMAEKDKYFEASSLALDLIELNRGKEKDLEPTLNLLLEDMEKRLKFPWIGIFLLNAEKGTLSIKKTNAPKLAIDLVNKFVDKPIYEINIDISERNLLCQALSSKRIYQSRKLSDHLHPYVGQNLSEIIEKIIGTTTILSVPISYKEQGIGVMCIGLTEKTLNSNITDFIQFAADKIGIAFANILNL